MKGVRGALAARQCRCGRAEGSAMSAPRHLACPPYTLIPDLWGRLKLRQ